MDQKTQSLKWLLMISLCGIGFIFGYFIYILSTKGVDPAYSRWMIPSRSEPGKNIHRKSMSQPSDNSFLVKDQQKSVGRFKITYRGVEGQAVILDFILPDLDREYVYHRRIPMKEAKRGFQLSENRFRMESVGKDRIRMIRIPSGAF